MTRSKVIDFWLTDIDSKSLRPIVIQFCIGNTLSATGNFGDYKEVFENSYREYTQCTLSMYFPFRCILFYFHIIHHYIVATDWSGILHFTIDYFQTGFNTFSFFNV